MQRRICLQLVTRCAGIACPHLGSLTNQLAGNFERRGSAQRAGLWFVGQPEDCDAPAAKVLTEALFQLADHGLVLTLVGYPRAVQERGFDSVPITQLAQGLHVARQRPSGESQARSQSRFRADAWLEP